MGRVCIIGCGVVGATMLRADPSAFGIERDPARRAALIAEGLDVSGELARAADAELRFVCIGTPSTPSGHADTTAVAEVVAALDALPRRDGAVIVVRSTMPPHAVPRDTRHPVLVNPELLRARFADHDFRHAPFVLVGADPAHAPHAAAVFAWYESVGAGAPRRLVSIETALLTKYAFNWWRCVKVEFANLIGDAAAAWGADAASAMALFAEEPALNLSMAYLEPGGPFGGECLPKDLLAGVLDLGAERAALLATTFARNHARGGPDPRPHLAPMTSPTRSSRAG